MSDKDKIIQLENKIKRLRMPAVFYSADELAKTIEAIKEKHGIPSCDSLPYYPQETKIILTGKIVNE